MPKGPERRTVRRTVRMSESLDKKIKAAAWADHRSPSDWMVVKLEDAVDRALGVKRSA